MEPFIDPVKTLYGQRSSSVKVGIVLSEEYKISKHTTVICIDSILFKIDIEQVLKAWMKKYELNFYWFANDHVLIAKDTEDSSYMLRGLF